ncbi:hypothetical protein BTS2_2204 [Bacillus sp. TS-2]|nr:hypothetical protein BTS2_2204 [Bacillus sp. TS-2]
MKKVFVLVIVLMISTYLVGCFYPEEERVQNQVPYPEQLELVRSAVERFQEDSGVLPIKTFEDSTSLYQRYQIDFNQLVPRYLQEPPGTAFESGGVYTYVLWNVDEEPEVKLIDLTTMRDIQEMQQKLNDYRNRHSYAPVAEVLNHGLFKLDYEALGYSEEPYVKSPYYDTFLPILLTNDWEIIIDYQIDLNIALEEHDGQFEPGDDIREILIANSPFVPNRSIPYTIDENGEPIYNYEGES